jgi:hypothetical protein
VKDAIIVAGAVAGIFLGGLLGRISFGGNGEAGSLVATLIGATLGVLAAGFVLARVVGREN